LAESVAIPPPLPGGGGNLSGSVDQRFLNIRTTMRWDIFMYA
jgi:hypothetical protein